LDVEFIDIERGALGLLRVTIDRPEGVRIEDCEQVSKHLSRVFEVENIDYRRLEVGSPGVDRPLKTESDYQRFVGERVEVKLREAVDNQKVFSGLLVDLSGSISTAGTEAQSKRLATWSAASWIQSWISRAKSDESRNSSVG
jgi:ribosome maturation factor RimP